MKRLDRASLRMHMLEDRRNLLNIWEIAVSPDDPACAASEAEMARIRSLAQRIRAARNSGRAVMLTYGAHLVKNGLGPIVSEMIRDGWLTHVATNGAGSIHDWEFAHIGMSGEDVRENVATGRFGTWEETGRFINLAVAFGGVSGLGYGESVGRFIAEDGLDVHSRNDIKARIADLLSVDTPGEELGALSDALALVSDLDIAQGRLAVDHPWKHVSIQHAAWTHGVPFTVHPGIGYDIIYTHPANCGGAIGRGAVRDFLAYAQSVGRLEGGVHIVVGSAIMAPMIFEKALSMANNLAIEQNGQPISNHYLAVVDVQDGGGWDWSQGEPPKDNPAYYLRFCKSFYRMGGALDYLCMDNRRFIVNLHKELARSDD